MKSSTLNLGMQGITAGFGLLFLIPENRKVATTAGNSQGSNQKNNVSKTQVSTAHRFSNEKKH